MQLHQRIKITEKTINPRKGFCFLRFRFTLNLLTGGQFKKLVTGCFCIIALSGCATFNTLDTELPLNERMFVYSGTRLDWVAITKNHPALKKIKVEPPQYPLVDLPISFILDSFFFPLAVIAEIFQ
jgi:uncharacterized protein YceK